ncbi:NACHT and TPR domain-containing protein [Plectosphaerella cucumerina]|uniref:NACHT and TPR domain-containing protein n=1 Tax=Plectosphaerella cucumerina TaxID=40658 RepID=A0A8K0TBX8_9PEZI|nr:NACHT and TPR domain-containing protein [Plectosphaerella cucumerina]
MIQRQVSQFASVLEDAQKQYAELRGQELTDFMKPPMKSVEDMLAVINRQNNDFDNFRSRRQKLFHAMSVALVPLETVGESLAGAASEVFAPSQNIFAAVMYLVNAARDVSSCYDTILELFERLKDFTSRLNFYVSQRLSQELRDKIVKILVTLFEVLVLATAEIRQGRAKAYFKRLIGQESPVNEPLKRLAILTEAERGIVGAETLAVVKQSLSNEERLYEMMSRVDINVQTLRSQTREMALSTNKDKLKGILQPTVYPRDTYDVLDRTRTQGTCEWVLNDPSLDLWLSGQIRFLWITGNPGTGKSYLTARLVRWGLRLLEEQETSHMLGYFFFRQTTPQTRSVIQALRDIAFQISEEDVFYGKQLLRLLSSSDDIKTVASAFRRLLIEPCKPDKWRRHIYILLDGIDEADPAQLRDFLTLLDGLNQQSATGTRVQVALIGRNAMTDNVLQNLQNDSTGGQQFRTLHVTPERNGQDVMSYISDGVNKARVLHGTPQSFRNEIIQVMSERVDGLFILAKFMLNAISTERHARGIIEKLQSYPKEINGMLTQTVLSFSRTITKADAADLNEILQWVSCAEETLSLEQIESILALRFGECPLHLEGHMRTQLASFFTLEREDGLSTAELVERYQAQKQMMADMGDDDHSPTRRSPDFHEVEGDIEYFSNKSTTGVTFFHASVSEFFRDGCSTNIQASPSHPSIGFDLSEAKLHVLKTCLRIFTDPNYFAFGASGLSLQKYAAWYWQEHLEHIDLASVSPKDKADVGKLLYTMLNERPVVLAWTNLFEESLDIWTDGNIDGVRAWLADPDAVSELSEEGKAWARAAAKSSTELLRPTGRVFADAWLKEDFGLYMPTLFCFGVVQCLALMETGVNWEESEYHWGDVPLETRVNMATKWANLPKTGHYYRRTGSTLLNLGLHEEALARFEKALKLDGNIVETCGRMGYCYAMAGNYEQALNRHLMSNFIDEKNLKEKTYKTPRDIKYAKWRVYKNLYQLAECYRKLGRVESAVHYCREAINKVEDAPPFEPEAALMRILAENNRVTEITDLLRELDGQFLGEGLGHSRLVFFLLDQIPSNATRDWIPDAAARTGKTDVTARRYRAAIALAQDAQDSRKEYYLRNALGRVYMAAGNYDEAISIQEAICFQDYKPRGSIGVRLEYAGSFKNLACLYYLKALQLDATLRSEVVESWIGKLEKLKQQQSRYENRNVPLHMAGFDVNEASIFLVLFYRFRERPAAAKELASKLVTESIDILEDDEPQNDEIGVRNLQRILIAAGDLPNARALWQSTRKPTTATNAPSRRNVAADRRISSPRPGVSPKRGAHELNLTKVFSEGGDFAPALACDYCLRRFEVQDEYAVCTYCIDTLFCLACLENTIKLRSFSPGHSSACGPTHSWMTVPPLQKELAHGEIMVDGRVTRLDEWKTTLRTAYRNPRQRRHGTSPSLGLGIH